MPNLTMIDPCDAVEIEQATAAIAAHPGPVYMRLLRGKVPLVLDDYGYRFELGKAKMLREGREVLFISTGLMTMRVLEAVKALEADHIDCAVLHVPTIKPLDAGAILTAARKPGRLVVVAENHSVVGGLGEAVATVLMREGVAPAFRHIGLPTNSLTPELYPLCTSDTAFRRTRSPSRSAVGSHESKCIERRGCRSSERRHRPGAQCLRAAHDL